MPNDCPDDFTDVINRSHGVFGTDQPGLQDGVGALDVHDSPVNDVQPQGAIFDFDCDGCGKTVRMTLEYPEVIALKFRLSPHVAYPKGQQRICADPSTWAYQQGENKWRVKERCQCGFHFRLELSAGEPEAILKRARREDYLPKDYEAQVQAHCHGLYQRLSATRARR